MSMLQLEIVEMTGEKLLKVSVVIPNYNYESFVGAAIESALALDWPDVEIIVVDDGSTDGSRQVIERYADRVTPVFKANGGPATACNAGYALATGDLIIFLDSDDLVDPSLIREVAAVLTPQTSKVQVQMQTVDAEAKPLGNVFPKYGAKPTPGQIRQWAASAGSYPTPPGSGNVYTRRFLDQLFPLDLTMDRATDSYFLSTAPFLGEVVTIAKPLVSYRVHGKNIAAMASLNVSRFSNEVRRAVKRSAFSAGVAQRSGVTVRPQAFRGSLNVCALRASSLALTPGDHPIEGDSRLKLIGDAVGAVLRPQGNSSAAQAVLFFWVLAIAATPRALATRLIQWRYVPAARPAFLKRAVARV